MQGKNIPAGRIIPDVKQVKENQTIKKITKLICRKPLESFMKEFIVLT